MATGVQIRANTNATAAATTEEIIGGVPPGVGAGKITKPHSVWARARLRRTSAAARSGRMSDKS
ncbi:hypothetical protein GCM10009679_35110 [Saccharothrix algeriensis]